MTAPTRLSADLQVGDVLRFWLPLCATWLMMAAEGPVLTSVIARLPSPDFNLAAYGVAVAVAMFIESPVIMLLSTTVALARDRNAFERLRAFMGRLNALVTAGMLVVTLPWVYDVVANTILHLPADVSSRMYQGLLCMIPWPAAIGYRRFYQGLLIRAGLTRRVAYGTVVRFGVMAGTSVLLRALTDAPGIVIGTGSLTAGVILEAMATRWMVRGVVRGYRRQDSAQCAPAPTYGEILRFYLPLALTSLMGFVVTPMLAFFMSRAAMPVASLAVLPVVDSLIFLFRSFGFSYQEVGIALLGEQNRNYPVVRRVGQIIITATTVAVALVAITPLGSMIYQHAYGITAELADVAWLPTLILVPLPALAVLYSLQRAVLITARRNVVVTWSTITEVSCIALVMVIVLAIAPLPGAVAAAIAMVCGRIFANIYLFVRTRDVLHPRSPLPPSTRG